MQINKDILKFLEDLLGRGTKRNKSYYSFKCPLVNHRKSELWIELKTGKYQCFACQNLKGNSLYSLLKKIKADKSKFIQLSKILNDDIQINTFEVENKSKDILKLPDEFWPLSKSRKSFGFKDAYLYITKDRKIPLSLIKKYNIGYCEEGKYKERIIIPSYDKEGKLNYFTSRTYNENIYKKYLNPSIPRDDIIPFEQYISWNIPIILVEGFFDAISVDYNSIPLLGKKISKKVIENLIKNDIDFVYLMLDGDAIGDYFDLIQTLKLYDIYTKPIFLESNEDPNSINKDILFNKFKSTKIFTNEDILKLKIGEIYHG